MSKALNHMINLIAQGYDFSDAAFKAASKYKVVQSDLEQAYDNQ